MKIGLFAFACPALTLACAFPAAAGTEEKLRLIPPNQNPAAGDATYFTGDVRASSSFKGTGESRLAGGTVSFAAGARTHWHSHPLGQLLVVTAGTGWIQAEGESVRRISTGDMVWTAPGVKHWHGATARSAMTHVAITEASGGSLASWFGPVGRSQYSGPE